MSKNVDNGSAQSKSGRGQGDGGGWPSSTENPSGKGRSNKPPAGRKDKQLRPF